MFDLKTLEVIKQIKVGPGLDGIMYDEPDDKIILTNHSRPIGTLTAIDPKSGDIVATVELEDTVPEGAAADVKGHIFVNNEGKNTIQVIDVKTWKATESWPLAPCQGPTGIAYDKASNRIFSGCNNTSVVVDPSTGKVVATIKNGTGWVLVFSGTGNRSIAVDWKVKPTDPDHQRLIEREIEEGTRLLVAEFIRVEASQSGVWIAVR